MYGDNCELAPVGHVKTLAERLVGLEEHQSNARDWAREAEANLTSGVKLSKQIVRKS